MKILMVLILNLLSCAAFAQLVIRESQSKDPAWAPGDQIPVIVEVVDTALLNTLGPAQLLEEPLDGKIYFSELEPFVKRMGDNYLRSQGLILLTNEAKLGRQVISYQGQEVWVDLQVKFDPALAPKAEQFFYYPTTRSNPKKSWVIIITVCVIAITTGLYGYIYYQKRKKISGWRKKMLIAQQDQWIAKIEAANDIAEISKVWVAKSELIAVFPKAGDAINGFTTRLNSFHFKPHLDSEDNEALKSAVANLKRSLEEHRGV